MRGGTVVAATLAAALAGAGVGAEGLVEWQELVIPGVCTLRIAVPQGWSASMARPAPGAAEVRVTPESGPRALVTLTSPVPGKVLPMTSTGAIKAAVRRMGEAELPTSVEKKLTLERLGGTDGAGFFYSLTEDRQDPTANESRYVTRGIMAVGPLRLAVTVLATGPDSAARAVALDLLRTAECVGAGERRQ